MVWYCILQTPKFTQLSAISDLIKNIPEVVFAARDRPVRRILSRFRKRLLVDVFLPVCGSSGSERTAIGSVFSLRRGDSWVAYLFVANARARRKYAPQTHTLAELTIGQSSTFESDVDGNFCLRFHSTWSLARLLGTGAGDIL